MLSMGAEEGEADVMMRTELMGKAAGRQLQGKSQTRQRGKRTDVDNHLDYQERNFQDDCLLLSAIKLIKSKSQQF